MPSLRLQTMDSLRHGRLLLTPPPTPNPPLYKSMLVAFAGAFCAAVAYVLASSIRRCFLCHHQRRRQQEQESFADEEHRERCNELHGIPVTIFGSGSGTAREGEVEGETSCSVCLADYGDGEEVRVLPRCGHMFHKECIDRWLVTRSSSCPVCRGRVIKRPKGPAAPSCG